MCLFFSFSFWCGVWGLNEWEGLGFFLLCRCYSSPVSCRGLAYHSGVFGACTAMRVFIEKLLHGSNWGNRVLEESRVCR